MRFCNGWRYGKIVIIRMQFDLKQALGNQDVLFTFSNIPTPIGRFESAAIMKNSVACIALESNKNLISGGGSTLIQDWMSAVIVYVTSD